MGFLAIVGQICMISAYRAASATVVAPFQYSQILWALPYGMLLFGETPDPIVWVGASIIVGSGLFILWRESRANVSEISPVTRNPNPRPDVGPSPRPRPLKLPEPAE
jgi:S-adenosylmethionine uptake transporter